MKLPNVKLFIFEFGSLIHTQWVLFSHAVKSKLEKNKVTRRRWRRMTKVISGRLYISARKRLKRGYHQTIDWLKRKIQERKDRIRSRVPPVHIDGHPKLPVLSILAGLIIFLIIGLLLHSLIFTQTPSEGVWKLKNAIIPILAVLCLCFIAIQLRGGKDKKKVEPENATDPKPTKPDEKKGGKKKESSGSVSSTVWAIVVVVAIILLFRGCDQSSRRYHENRRLAIMALASREKPAKIVDSRTNLNWKLYWEVPNGVDPGITNSINDGKLFDVDILTNDSKVMSFKSYYRGKFGEREVNYFYWDKTNQLGKWEQKNPPSHGEWSLKPDPIDPEHRYMGGISKYDAPMIFIPMFLIGKEK